MSQTQNPPAFPSPDVRTHDGFGISEGSLGMTLRDWFAGQAIAVMASSALDARTGPDVAARAAYQLADAMLVARAPAAEPPLDDEAFWARVDASVF